MKRRDIICIYTTAAIFLSFNLFFLSSARAQDPCSLFTQTDAETLFKEPVSKVEKKKGMFPAGEICQYSFIKNGERFSITVKLSTTPEIKEEGINESAEDVFARQKKARLANEFASKTFKPIEGIGDDGFWNGNNLWILKGDSLIIITVNSKLTGSYKDRDSAEQARYEQDLALSKKSAEVILSRFQ